MKNRKISIIIPAYNAGKTILNTINSVLKQTYNNYEIIVIDDGSKDNTAKIVKEISLIESKILYYYKKNGGVSSARNKGIEVAKGEYICFLDADDYFEKSFLEKMYNKIAQNESDVCYCGYNIDDGNLLTCKKTQFKKKNVLLKQILGKVNIHTTGWMIRRKFLIKNPINFIDGMSWGEDFLFFNEILACTKKICYVNEYLTNYKADHDIKQLSSFSLDKIDKDYELIMMNIENTNINQNKQIENALLKYRLPALIIYRLTSAIDKGFNKNEIDKYYDKYNIYIKKAYFNNGIRSIKLNIYRKKLKTYLK